MNKLTNNTIIKGGNSSHHFSDLYNKEINDTRKVIGIIYEEKRNLPNIDKDIKKQSKKN